VADFLAKALACSYIITDNTGMGLCFEEGMGDGDWRIALAMD